MLSNDSTVAQIVNYGSDKVVIVTSGTSGDTLILLKLKEDGCAEVVAEHTFDKKIQRLALDANLVHGKAKPGSSNENDFYIERSSGTSHSVPISMMNFGGFGGEDEANESEENPTFIV